MATRGFSPLLRLPLRLRLRLRLPLAQRHAHVQARATTTRSRGYATSKQPSPSTTTTSRFYRTFARPVAKALVLAVFTYQVVYWAWARLEADEARAETDAVIARLEAEVGAYEGARRTKRL